MPSVLRGAAYAVQLFLEIGVGSAFDGAGDFGLGGAAMGRIVFEAAIARRIVGWRDDDAIGQTRYAAFVVDQNGVADRGCRRVAVLRVDHCGHAVGGKHFERGFEGGFGEGVRVLAEIKRAIDGFRFAVIADGLRDRQNMVFVEGGIECRAAMAGGAEAHALGGDGGIGLLRIIGGLELGQIDEIGRLGHFARAGVCLFAHEAAFAG